MILFHLEEWKNIYIELCYGDFSLFNHNTAWRPAVSLRSGLDKTVRFYQTHFDHYWT